MQLAGAGNLHIEKKGTIDLVTEIDKQVEQEVLLPYRKTPMQSNATAAHSTRYGPSR